ncbi:hypothetical protein FF1_003493 [Malus domestica]
MAKCTLLLVLLLVLGCALTSSGKSIKTENTGAKSCGESSASLNRSSFRRVSCSVQLHRLTSMKVLQMKVVEDQVYGIHTCTTIQRR